jgi:ribosomal protein L37AE/L43A
MKDDVYNPSDLDNIRREQQLERKLIETYICPLCKRKSFALYRSMSYMECQNSKCKAIGVPSRYITKQIINDTEINIFSPDGSRRLI